MSTFIVTLPNQGAAYYSLEVSARRYAALRMGILLVILSLSFIRTAAAGVEQVQRDVQARYHLLTGGYLQWPQCAAGQTPAPQFPKDGFYGDLVEEQDLGVKIVQDLVQKFYTDNIIYTYFIHATNGYSDLVNVSAITNYIQSDMEPIIHASDVTKINYLDELQAVATQIAKLKLIKVQATQVVDSSRDHKYNWGWNQGTDCGGVLSCLAGYQDAASWGGRADTEYVDCCNPPHTCNILGPFTFPTQLSDKILRFSSSESGYETGPWVSGEFRNTRGKISADLTSYSKGIAVIYLKLSAVNVQESSVLCPGCGDSYSSTFSTDAPTSADAERFGAWSQGVIQLGAHSTTDYVTYSQDTSPASGGCAFNLDAFVGWQLDDQVVVVQSDFTTVPDPQDCCPCSTCEAGTTETTLNSIHVNIGLGGDNFDGSAGALILDADQPSLALATPSSLRYSPASTVETVTDSSSPVQHLQFKTSQVLANIVTNNAFKYTVSLYIAADAGTKDGNGFYQPTGTAFTTVVIENPDATNIIYNRLRITKTTDSTPTVTDYIYGSGTGGWEMDTGSGMRKEFRLSVWDGTKTIRTETLSITNANNQLAYKEINTYQLFSWGQERIQNVINPDGAALTNTWGYYTNAATDGGNYRQIKQMIDASGHWTTNQYDQSGRETNRLSQFLNSTVGSAANSNRVTATIYSTNTPQITIIETLLGAEIRREYEVLSSGEVDHYRCQSPGALWNAAENLISITKKYTNGSFAGQLQRVQNPDGIVQIYFYSTNDTQKTTTVLSGVADPNSGTNILSGTKTITVNALGGQILSTTTANVVPGSPDVIIDQETNTYLDSRNRSYQVAHLDATTNFYFYACCGLDSEVDRDGTTTSYFYDALKRRTASQRLNIMTTNVLDALGRTLATIRIGTNGSWSILQQSSFDMAGRVSTQTNALNGVMAFTNILDGSGQTVKTTTDPDGGTRVETYAQDGTLVKRTGTAVNPVRYVNAVEPENGTNRYFSKEIKLDANGNDTSEWTKTYFDMLNRPYSIVYASASGTPALKSYYNNLGQLVRQVDPDGVTALYQYNSKGELAYTAVDVNTNFVVDFAGLDRITWTTNDVATDYGTTVLRSRTYMWDTNNVNASNLVATVERSVDGLKTWSMTWNNGTAAVTKTQATYTGSGTRYVTNTAPDNSFVVNAYSYGRLNSVTSYSSTGAQLSQNILGYDEHGRVKTVTDARDGTTTYGYNNADQVISTTTPPPGTGQGPQTTLTYYDNFLRATNVVYPDNTSVTNEYYQTGLVKRTYGSRSYPAGYAYDAQGRMKSMTNWTGFATSAGARVTTWNYNPYRGWLDNKRYPDNTGPNYSHTSGGRLSYLTWARSGQYNGWVFNSAGDVSTKYYPASGPFNVYYGYDRRGRQNSITNGATVTTLTYNNANELLSETYSGGTLAGLSVTKGYDTLLRRTTLFLNTQPAAINVTYGYDYASRLTNVTDGTYSAGYTYLANSPLISQITFQQSGATKMTTTRQYDYLNRLLSISSSPGASGQWPLAYGYAYNAANQRTRVSLADGSYWVYGYDFLGQVTSGKKYWSDGTPVSGEQFEYGFDDIGNRNTTKAGGDQSGTGLRSASYTANSLNQYTSRTVPNAFDVLGIANVASSVTVNGSGTDLRRGEYFQELVGVSNGSTSVWQAVTVTTSGGGTNTGNVFVPTATESYGFDADGNLTNDGRWTFTWDAENRLTSMQALSTVPSGAKKKLDFSYDYQGRRILKIVSTWNGSTYVPASTNKFLYDGWNMVAELNGTNGVIRSCIWGLDISGGLQGAGGVGALLAIKPTGTNTLFVACDGNGNVSGLIDATTGTISANYEYGPFGELIRLTGAMAKTNPFRFSTKYQDDESDFLYYGYRYYNPSTGRWLSRDPSQEDGGLNLFAFADNNGVNAIDDTGLGVIYIVHADGREEITYTPPPPSGFLQTLWSGNGNSKTKARACKSKCDELKELLMKAYVADDVYKNRDGLQQVPGAPNYERLSDEQLKSLGIDPSQMADDKSGFYSALYANHIGGNYLLAFRGTQPLTARDDVTDLAQGVGLPSRQYTAAARLGSRLGQIFPGQISGVGHSLGGGLDTVAALSGTFPALNFNAAGVHPYTANRLGIDLDNAQDLVVNYSTPGDFLTRGANRTFLAPPTDGRQVMLPSPGSLPLGINRHSMVNVIAAIQKAMAEKGCK